MLSCQKNFFKEVGLHFYFKGEMVRNVTAICLMKSVFERAESLPHISGTKPWKLEVPGKSGGPKLWEDQMGISLPFVCPAQGLLCCERSLETS